MFRNKIGAEVYYTILDEIDHILESKGISYAHFSKHLGITAITFYNNYKNGRFSINDMISFLEIAGAMPPNTIHCLKCNKEFELVEEK